MLADGRGTTTNVAQWDGAAYVDVEKSLYNGNGLFRGAQGVAGEIDLGLYARYAGRQYDSLTDVSFYKGRAYDPVIGRFVSLRATAPGANAYTNSDATAELVDPVMTPSEEVTWWGATKQVFSDAAMAVREFVVEYGMRVVQFVGGAIQFVGGAAATIFTGGIGGFLGGGLAMAFGFDDMYHAVSGGETWKSQAGRRTAEALGGGETAQDIAGFAADFAGGLIGGGGAAAGAKVLGKVDDVARLLGKTDDAMRLSSGVDDVADASRRVSKLIPENPLKLRQSDEGTWFLKNGGCFTDDTLVLVAEPASSVVRPQSTATLTQTAIQAVSLGSRVVAENPRPEEVDHEFSQPDASSWVRFTATVRRSDGAIVELEALRPKAWADVHGVVPGAKLFVSYPELQLYGEVFVREVTACPPIAEGTGHVVIGRFITRNVTNLVRLRLADETTIDVTDTHLFWSVDRHDWVAAGELQPGERLDGNDGVATIAEVKPLGHAPAVYNLEVHGQHVFRVATPAVLVHNTNPCTGGRFGPNKLAVAEAIERGELSVVRPGRIGATKGSGIHEHHVFPQEHKALFKKRGIDVHDYAVDVPVSSHQAIHGGGDFKLGRTWRGEWNTQIMRELKQTTRAAGRRLTPDEIVSVAENLMSRYGISGELHRYSRAPKR